MTSPWRQTSSKNPDEFRITDGRGNVDFQPINDGSPEGAIAAFKADFVITDTYWRASARQAQAEGLLDLSSKLAATAPQLVVGILDLVIEAMDVPKREEIVQRVRKLNGQEDPDADPENPSPETLAMREQSQKQSAMAERAAAAQMAELDAKVRIAQAQAAKAETSLTSDQIAQIMAAVQAAITIAGAPAVAAAADQVLLAAQNEAMASAQAGQAIAQHPPATTPPDGNVSMAEMMQAYQQPKPQA